MKRIYSTLVLIVLATPALLAQEQARKAEVITTRDYRSKIFTITHRDPNTLASAVRLLGSGLPGAEISVNTEINTLTVRDFPENIATIEEALTRLDQPAAPAPSVELKISVLIGSRTPFDHAVVPEELAGVVKELQSTLTYGHYGLMTTTLHRTRGGSVVDGSGVAEPALLATLITQNQPVTYRYRLRGITVSEETVGIHSFQFSMQFGMQGQQQSVGFETPVNLSPREKVVIGTTTMGDKALIVVVTATVTNP